MTDFGKHQPVDPNQPPSGPPPGGFPPPPAQGGFPPPPQGAPGQPGGYPQYGGYSQPGGQYGGQYGGQPGGYPQQPGGYPQAGGQYGGYPPAPYGGNGLAAGYGGFQIPPGVELASVGRRIGAYFLAFPLAVVTLFIGYVIWGAVVWGKGTSPALQVLGMRCVDANTGQPVGWGKMALRDIIGGIVGGLFGIMYIVSFVMFLSGDRHQSVPDKIGGTVVVYDPNKVFG